MAGISAAKVKELREKTSAGMMDCKKALVECDGDISQAADWLRKKGLSAAAKKGGRVASEGLVSIAVEGNKGAVVELNSETDFVARNEKFQALVKNIAEVALKANSSDVEQIKAQPYPETGRNVAEEINEHIAIIGENMTLRRAAALSVSQGAVVSYIHNAVAENIGKIAVLVGLESSAPADKLQALGKQIAMHIAAANPQALDVASVDAVALEKERTILSEQARASGKPESIIEKMVEGRVRKYYEEVVLLEQIFVIDGKTKISDVVEAAAKEAGAPISVTGYTCLRLGEGVEKKEDDFAAEVAAAVNG